MPNFRFLIRHLHLDRFVAAKPPRGGGGFVGGFSGAYYIARVYILTPEYVSWLLFQICKLVALIRLQHLLTSATCCTYEECCTCEEFF
jgi:hypothetical protein